jgi:hypothetical protein
MSRRNESAPGDRRTFSPSSLFGATLKLSVGDMFAKIIIDGREQATLAISQNERALSNSVTPWRIIGYGAR